MLCTTTRKLVPCQQNSYVSYLGVLNIVLYTICNKTMLQKLQHVLHTYFVDCNFGLVTKSAWNELSLHLYGAFVENFSNLSSFIPKKTVAIRNQQSIEKYGYSIRIATLEILQVIWLYELSSWIVPNCIEFSLSIRLSWEFDSYYIPLCVDSIVRCTLFTFYSSSYIAHSIP